MRLGVLLLLLMATTVASVSSSICPSIERLQTADAPCDCGGDCDDADDDWGFEAHEPLLLVTWSACACDELRLKQHVAVTGIDRPPSA